MRANTATTKGTEVRFLRSASYEDVAFAVRLMPKYTYQGPPTEVTTVGQVEILAKTSALGDPLTTLVKVTLISDLAGQVRVSVYDGYVSVWANGLPILEPGCPRSRGWIGPTLGCIPILAPGR